MQNAEKNSLLNWRNEAFRLIIILCLILFLGGYNSFAMSYSGKPVFPPEYPIMKYEDVDVKPKLIGGAKEIKKLIDDLGLYPKIAKEKGIRGSVEVQFIIDENGKTTNCVIQDENPEGYDFGEAAKETVLRLEYKPGSHCRRPVKVLMKLTIPFTI